jgi:alpha-maltose-1-phosphate synthase
MKVVQTVFGKFHHFHLARQLHKRSLLAAIFSSYPEWKLKDQGIPMSLVKTFPWVHLSWFVSQRYGVSRKYMSADLSWLLAISLDSYVRSRMPPCDVFIGISGSGLSTGQMVQSRGGKYICDRGSSHIAFGNQLMRDEYRRWDAEYQEVDRRHIQREEREYAAADRITVPSEFARQSYISLGIAPEKVSKVPYGADLSKFSKMADPSKNSFDVLFVGQVSFRKGIPYLLEAFEQLKHPNKTLTVAGSVQPEIEQFLRSRQNDQIRFLGIVRNPDLKELMSRSHVLVLPSIEEGLAMVMGEALACGCPVIGSTNCGASDLFDNGREGYIVPIRDSKAISSRLEQLAQQPNLRQQMSDNALERVQKIGGWDVYGENYVSLLEEVTAE